MNTIAKRYKSFLTTYPVITHAIQTGILMGSGDLLAQTLVEKKSFGKVDLARTGKFAFIGTVYVGPCLRLWYGKLDLFFGNKGKVSVFKKVFADQLLFTPVFLFVLMVVVNVVNGETTLEIMERIEQNYTDVLKNNFLLWPGVQLLNFYLVPLEFRVVVVQVVALFWNTYLAWKINKKQQTFKEIS